MKIGRAKVSNLRKLYQNCIKVHDIAEPLFIASADDDAPDVRKKMNALDYNVAGVMEDDVVTGYLTKSNLKQGKCSQYIKKFSDEELVVVSNPLLSDLSRFKERAYLFGVKGKSVSYIISRSDLQKIPVRMLLFGLLSLMELHVLYLIRKSYSGNQWISLLSESRIVKAKQIQDLRKERNEVIDLLEGLQFGDKKKIFECTPALVKATHKSKKQLHKFFEDAEALRDNLAHVQDILAGRSWVEFINLLEDIQEFIYQCESLE